MFPIFESKDKHFTNDNYKTLVYELIERYLKSGGRIKKTKTKLYFYDSRQNEISESINYYPELLWQK